MSSAFLGNITGIFELFECSKTSWDTHVKNVHKCVISVNINVFTPVYRKKWPCNCDDRT